MTGHSLAIVGATGAVGLKLLQIIDEADMRLVDTLH